jgi:hypothetical protein
MNHRQFLFVLLLFSFAACGGPFDITGRGAKTECFYLDVPSLTVVYACDQRSITYMLVSTHTTDAEKGRVVYTVKPDTITRQLPLSISRDSLAGIEIELYLSASGPRESYYIDIDARKLRDQTKIYARLYSH